VPPSSSDAEFSESSKSSDAKRIETKGERRGGRQRGTPNKSTALKKAALSANYAASILTSRNAGSDCTAGLRVQVARAAAPLVHGKLRSN
jgi:hypothetical protein